MFKSPKTNQILALVAAITVAGVAVPAMAKSNEGQVRLTVEKRAGKTVYCTRQNITGSITPLKTCFTQADWAQRGAEFNVPVNGLASAANQHAASQN